MSGNGTRDSRARRIRLPPSCRHVAPTLVAVLPVLAFGCLAIAGVRRNTMLGGDQAVLELWSRSAAHGKALLGPYSRFGWNHPGPALFYWFAPFYLVTGQRPEGLGIASLLLVVGGLGYVSVLVGRVVGRAGAWTAAAVALAFVLATGTDWFDETWNPVVIVAPMIVLGVACAGVVAGRRWCLVAAVACATFSIQTHVGTLPVAFVWSAIATVACGVRLYRSREGWLGPIVSAVVVGVGLWLPPLYEQVTRTPGNLRLLARSNIRNAGAHHSLRDVYDTTAAQFTLSGRGLMGQVLGRLGTTPVGAGPLRLVWLIVLVTAAIASAVRAFRTGRPFEAALSGGGVVAALVLMISLTRVQGALLGYLTLSAIAVGFVMYLGIALTVVGELRRVRTPRLNRVVASLVTVAGVALAFVALTRTPSDAVYSRHVSAAGAPQTLESLRARLPPGHGGVDIVIDEQKLWPVASLVANQLERSGFRTAETPDWLYMFGRQRSIDGCESARVHVSLPTDPIDAAMEVVGQIDLGQIRVQQLDPPPRCRR